MFAKLQIFLETIFYSQYYGLIVRGIHKKNKKIQYILL